MAQPQHHTATGMEFLFILSFCSLFLSSALSAEILYDGRAKPDFNADVLDKNSGPYLTYVTSPFRGEPTEWLCVQRCQGV